MPAEAPSAGRTSFENSTAKISTLGSMRQAGRRVLTSEKLPPIGPVDS
jgi:hypothetical protein